MIEDDPPPGVPEWVVTYGDMMSLLLTFFIMLVSMSEVKANKKFRAVLESLQKHVGYMSGPVAPPGDQFPLNSDFQQLETLGAFTNSKNKGGIRSRPAPVGKDLRTTVNRRGRGALVARPISFASESGEVDSVGETTISQIAKELAGKPNKVEILCSSPVNASPERIELTYNRARLILDRLRDLGVDRKRCRMVFRERPANAPQPDPLISPNDSVEIVMLDAYQNEYVGPRK